MSVDTVVEKVHRLLLDNLPIRTTRTPRISYNCFNCKYTTGWSPTPGLGKRYRDLATRLGADQKQIHDAQMDLLKYSEELENEEIENYVYSLNKFEVVDLPEDAVMLEDLPDTHEVKQYAKDRGIYGLYPLLWFDNDPLYTKRLVVPFTYNGELVGWTARHISPPDKQTPKYLHKMTSGYVFNVDRFVDTKRELVIVVEGVFDAIMIDGVAVLGNHVTAEQAHLISKLGNRIILCPDRDEPGKELIDEALALGWEVSFPPWEDSVKDATDAASKYGRLLTVASIIKHATGNKIKAQVKAKML